MGSLSVSNLIVSIGIAFDAQLKAADNLFFAAAVDFTDPTRPMFGGALGDETGQAVTLSSGTGIGYKSTSNSIAGDPVTIRQISTAEGPRYQITDQNGQEIKSEDPTLNSNFSNVPRYIVKSDGIVYDMLAPINASGTGAYGIASDTNPNGIPAYNTSAGAGPQNANQVTLQHYARPIGRITFKAKEGATLARAQDDIQRTSSVVQLLTRLLESIQDEVKGFSSLIR